MASPVLHQPPTEANGCPMGAPCGMEEEQNSSRDREKEKPGKKPLPFVSQQHNHSISDSSKESTIAQTAHQLQRHSSWITDGGTSCYSKLSSGNLTQPSPNRGRGGCTSPQCPCAPLHPLVVTCGSVQPGHEHHLKHMAAVC